MTTTVSEETLKSDIVRILAQFDDALANLEVPMTTTTGGSTTTVISTDLGLGSGASDRYNGRVVELLDAGSAGTPAAGEVAGVDDAGFNGTATLTVSPAFSDVVDTALDFLLYPRGYSPNFVRAQINETLRGVETNELVILSMIDDADHNANDITNWAAVGSPTTRAYVTTAANILFKERSLHIVTDSAAEGATSNSSSVGEGEVLSVWVPIQVITGGAKVQLYDVTNGAEITFGTTVDRAYGAVTFEGTVPNGCRQISIRFLNTVGASDFYVGPVVVQSDRRQRYGLPSWIVNKGKVMGSVTQPMGYRLPDSVEGFLAMSEPFRGGPELSFIDDFRSPAGMMVELDRPTHIQRVVFLTAKRPHAALTALTSTTPVDRDYVVYKTVARMLRMRGKPEWRDFGKIAAGKASNRDYGGIEMSVSTAGVY